MALDDEESPIYSLEVEPAGTRAGYLRRAHVRAARLADELDVVLKDATGCSDALACSLGLDSAQYVSVALAQALRASTSRIPRSSSASLASASRFAESFAKQARVGDEGWMVPPHLLPSMLESATQAVADLAPAVRDAPEKVVASHAWMTVIVGWLRDNAEPAFSGSQPTTPGVARSIRLAALCLAAEADSLTRAIHQERDHADLGRKFRSIAAGSIVIQRRATDSKWITERIMLAID